MGGGGAGGIFCSLQLEMIACCACYFDYSKFRLLTTSSPSFSLRDSGVSETQACVKIIQREKGETQRGERNHARLSRVG